MIEFNIKPSELTKEELKLIKDTHNFSGPTIGLVRNNKILVLVDKKELEEHLALKTKKRTWSPFRKKGDIYA